MFGPQRRPQQTRPAAVSNVTSAEAMEQRKMLSGNVVAGLVDGHLRIIGDNDPNDLRVLIDVDGTVSFESSGTTVNGQAAADVHLDGVVNSIAAAMGGGNDELVIESGENPNVMPHLDGSVTVRMWGGNDQLAIRGLDIAGRVYAAGGAGDDKIVMETTSVGGDLILAGNHGNDTVGIRYSDAGGNLSLRGGADDDTLVVGPLVIVDGEPDLNHGGGEQAAITADDVDDFDPYFSVDGGVADFGQQAGWYINGSIAGILADAEMADGFPAFDISLFEVTDSGLYYRIIDPGSANQPTIDDEVTVDYQGLNLDGSEFDSSYTRGESATFGLTNLIQGWQEGIPLVGEGGKIQLLIPSELAYGSRGAGSSIAPYATLFFNIELHSIV